MNIAKTIDHTLLKPEATAADIQALCREAKQYGFASVCVNTCYVKLASELLRGSGVNLALAQGIRRQIMLFLSAIQQGTSQIAKAPNCRADRFLP